MAGHKRECEFVYVMEAGPYFKIGIALDPVLRLRHIRAYNGHIAELAKAWYCPASARWIERLALNRVAHRRFYGEWCNGTGRHGVAAVRWAIQRVQSIEEFPPAKIYAYVKGGKSAVVK